MEANFNKKGHMKNLEEFRAEIFLAMKDKPKYWRDGQFVFNYIHQTYNVASYTRFVFGVDCSSDDRNIDEFINKCHEILMVVEENNNIFNCK